MGFDEDGDFESAGGQLFDDAPFVDPDAPGAADADAVVEDAALRAAGPPGYVSPSSASMYQQCPKRWEFRYIERLPDPPGEAALAGTFAHRVLELLFRSPGQARTVERARLIAREAWADIESHPDYLALALDDTAARAFRWKGWLAIEGLWKVEDPTTVSVKATEQMINTRIGEVPFRGVVDRLDRLPDGMAITDYKSGRAPTSRYAESRLSQVLLYAAAVESVEGERPRTARLVYLGQRVIDVAATDDVVAPVVEQLHTTWQSINVDRERQSFDTKPGPLCAWCPYAARCADGQVEIRRRAELGNLPAHAPAVVTLGLAIAS